MVDRYVTSKGILTLAIFTTNIARVAKLRRKMFGIKMTFPSITIFEDFMTYIAWYSSSVQFDKVNVCQSFQSVFIFSHQRVSAWNHQDQFLWCWGPWLLDLGHSKPCLVLQKCWQKSQVFVLKVVSCLAVRYVRSLSLEIILRLHYHFKNENFQSFQDALWYLLLWQESAWVVLQCFPHRLQVWPSKEGKWQDSICCFMALKSTLALPQKLQQ